MNQVYELLKIAAKNDSYYVYDIVRFVLAEEEYAHMDQVAQALSEVLIEDIDRTIMNTYIANCRTFDQPGALRRYNRLMDLVDSANTVD